MKNTKVIMTIVAVAVLMAGCGNTSENDSSEAATTTTAVSSTSKKSHGILIGVIAGIAAAISAVFIANKRKEK